MKNYKKGIDWTYLELNTFRQNRSNFDMETVTVTGSNGKQVTIDNEDFEKMIAEYQRRIQQLEKLNKGEC